MKTKDDTDRRVRKFFRKVCKKLDQYGERYNEDSVFYQAIIFACQDFTPKEVAKAIIRANRVAREKAEMN